MTFRKMGVGGAEEWHQVMSPDEAGCHHRTDDITPEQELEHKGSKGKNTLLQAPCRDLLLPIGQFLAGIS